MTIPFVITQNTALTVTVNTGNGFSYDEVLQNLGPISYELEILYLQVQNLNQFGNAISYKLFDVNGNQRGNTTPMPLDPSQYQSVMIVNMKDKGVILDGQALMNFNLNASESVQLYFYGKRISISDPLPKGSLPNFFEYYDSEV